MAHMTQQISDEDLEALEREAPLLVRVRRFAGGLDDIPWFANLGTRPTPGVKAAARAYLDALGFPDADTAILRDWDDAADAAESLGWDSPAWEAEELARADLTVRAMEALSDEALQLSLAYVADRAGAAAKAGMEEAAAMWDAFDEGSCNAAVGAAAQACHNAALSLIAAADPDFEAPSHPFAHKFQLFEFGRWPVGVAGLTFNLF